MLKLIALCPLFLLLACSMEPQAIDYGNDQCHYCKMTIVDVQHSAQYVSSKGKQFKFDAIECMIHDLKDKSKNDYAHILVADFNKPGNMIDARDASYLICEEIKSPMGEYLSAFEQKQAADSICESLGGDVFNWTDIKAELNAK
jgi:copper chaperone NosL